MAVAFIPFFVLPAVFYLAGGGKVAQGCVLDFTATVWVRILLHPMCTTRIMHALEYRKKNMALVLSA
jgi:hypothetical protein